MVLNFGHSSDFSVGTLYYVPSVPDPQALLPLSFLYLFALFSCEYSMLYLTLWEIPVGWVLVFLCPDNS